MSQNLEKRIELLEHAALQWEGASFAIRDILIRTILNTGSCEADEMLSALSKRANIFADQLGSARLTGYLDELDGIRVEIEVARRRRAEKHERDDQNSSRSPAITAGPR